MKKLICGLSLLLVAAIGFFMFSSDTTEVSRDDSYVSACAKPGVYCEEERNGEPDEGMDLT